MQGATANIVLGLVSPLLLTRDVLDGTFLGRCRRRNLHVQQDLEHGATKLMLWLSGLNLVSVLS